MKRLGLLGDVHAEDRLLEVALAQLKDADSILCVGDVADGLGDLDRTVKLLRDHGVRVVRGNHDRWIIDGRMRDLPDATRSMSDETRTWLAALPATLRIETVAGPLLLAHGLGQNDMIGVSDRYSVAFHLDELSDFGIDRDIAIHVSGHSHQRWVERIGDLLFINAGTLRRSDGPGFATLDLVTCEVAFIDLV
jgi:predicted phosphodiesterase